MNKSKVAFIICTNDDQYMDECSVYIRSLHVPDGMSIEIIPVKGARNMCAGYNIGMYSSDAMYKVYMHQDVFILNKDFIKDFLTVFDADTEIGMIGVAGSSDLPVDAMCFSAWDTGSIIECVGYRIVMHRPIQEHVVNYVWAVDGCMIITNRDVPWREDVFDSWDFYDISQGMEFMEAGFRIVVPYQEHPWCFHDCGILTLDSYDRNRKIFCETYPKYFSYEETDEHRESRERDNKVSKEIREILPEIRYLFDKNLYAEAIQSVINWSRYKNKNNELFAFYVISAIIIEEWKVGKDCLTQGRRNAAELLREYQLLRFRLFRLASDIELDIDIRKAVNSGKISVEAIAMLVDLTIYDKVKVYSKLLQLGIQVPVPESTDFFCPVCGHRNSVIRYKGEERQRQMDYEFKYSMTASDNYTDLHSICPKCGAGSTERFIKLFLQELSFDAGEVIGLNLVPDITDYRDDSWLDNDTEINWITEKSYVARWRRAESADLVLGINLLQNEMDDRQVIFDIFRILKKDGLAIIILPITHRLVDTVEAGEIGDAARMQVTGNYTARRLYAEWDFINRLREVGFFVQKINPDYFGDIAVSADVIQEQTMYVASKMDMGIGIPMKKNRLEV